MTAMLVASVRASSASEATARSSRSREVAVAASSPPEPRAVSCPVRWATLETSAASAITVRARPGVDPGTAHRVVPTPDSMVARASAPHGAPPTDSKCSACSESRASRVRCTWRRSSISRRCRGTGSASKAVQSARTPTSPSGPNSERVGTSTPPMPGTKTHSPTSVARAEAPNEPGGIRLVSPGRGRATKSARSPRSFQTSSRARSPATWSRSGNDRASDSTRGGPPFHECVTQSARRTEAGSSDIWPS